MGHNCQHKPMATIEKRTTNDGTVSYRAKVRLRGEKPRSRTFKRLTDAKVWASKVESDLGHGVYVPTSADRRRTFGEMIEKFVTEHLPTKTHNLDAEHTKPVLKWWKDEYGYVTLDKLKPEDFIEAKGKIAKRKNRHGEPLSGATINRYLAAASAVCKWGWKELRWLQENPVLSISKMSESVGSGRKLSDDERKALLAACRADHDLNIECCVVLALATGLRQANIRLLKWEDVDFTNWTLAIRKTKNGDARTVPVVGIAQRTLQAHYDRDPTKEGWVFKGYRNAAPWSLHSAWQRVRANAGLVGFRFHDLRHTVGRALTKQGASLGQVADALGHKTLAMAWRYSRQEAEEVRSTLASIADKLGDA